MPFHNKIHFIFPNRNYLLLQKNKKIYFLKIKTHSKKYFNKIIKNQMKKILISSTNKILIQIFLHTSGEMEKKVG
jgi:hypothetical protein